MAEATWHYLQVSDTLDREFASALSEFVPVLAWQPRMRLLPTFGNAVEEEVEVISENPPLRTRTFPLQKGFARVPESLKPMVAQGLLRRLQRQTENEAETPLVCSIPHFAGVAERWAGPVVYYLTDYIAGYEGADSRLVTKLDRRMCRAATLVCANSRRLANYLITEAGCSPEKVEVVPNATRAANILAAPQYSPFTIPPDVGDLPRPIAGTIGNMAANLDWVLLASIIDKTPDMSWLFVGPTDMPIQDEAQRQARQKLISAGGRIRFIGKRPYSDLVRYARAIDLGVVPYINKQPTTYGSSTRLYDHLASCRPILTNLSVPVPVAIEPFVHAFRSAEDASAIIAALRSRGFDDGGIPARWVKSQTETWQSRAFRVYKVLQDRRRATALEEVNPATTLWRLHEGLQSSPIIQSR